jgi:hypothetical protein
MVTPAASYFPLHCVVLSATRRPPRTALRGNLEIRVAAAPGPSLGMTHRHWVAEALAQRLQRDERWSQALAVDGKAFVDSVQHELGVRGRHRELEGGDVTHTLREPSNAYDCDFEGKKRILSSDNRRVWDEKTIASEA